MLPDKHTLMYNNSIMESLQITKEQYNLPVENSPSRFDMAINFYCTIKRGKSYYLVTYYYNPKWNLYYPFYDDKNKTPVIIDSEAKTYGQLVHETDKLLNINLPEKLSLAKARFLELVGSNCRIVPSTTAPIIYELKYSKTTGRYTMYKLYNYIITGLSNLPNALNPTSMPCKLFDLKNLPTGAIVSNALMFVSAAKDELIKYAIKLN